MEIFRIEEKTYSSNCYIIATDNRNAIVIDPNSFEEIQEILTTHGLTLKYILLTHEHYDHVCALEELKKYQADALVVAQKHCSEALPFVDQNKERFRLYLHYMGVDRHIALKSCKPDCADMEFDDNLELKLDDCQFVLKGTPGHSPGSSAFILNERYLFAGDSVLLAKDVVVKFSGGDIKLFENLAKPFFKSLKDSLIVMPGHGAPFCLSEKLKNDWKD
ncbi:MBL fold metallo-hydrolase [Clostridiales bacterium COT073_COT-073]|nr:MBL fold metallo-hydrolase [Clostridiales bacterium COT073_COT-073]